MHEMSAPVHAPGDPEMTSASLPSLSAYYLESGPFLESEIHILTRLRSQQAPETLLSLPTSELGFSAFAEMPSLLHWCKDQSSSPDYRASALNCSASLHPPYIAF